MGDAGPEYEASRLYSCDQRRLIRRGRRRHPIDRGAQAPAIVDQRGDVAELDTRLREIGDRADQRKKIGVVLHHFSTRPATTASRATRSEEHTSELQSLMRISYAV